MERPPQAIILAGPNGAGKTTTASQYVPETVSFVNADLIAQELSGVPGTAGDINAGRVLLEELRRLVEAQASFAVETTLSAKTLGNRIRSWREAGYEVDLIFVYLPSPDLAVERVAARVRAGGHAVPEETIRRRYEGGLRNLFNFYMPLVTSWKLIDNASTHDVQEVAEYNEGTGLLVKDEMKWANLTTRWRT
jgi:predicted ABC-type ATPase